jgi:hypothetical protein
MKAQFKKATRAVVTVGDARGFVVEGDAWQRYVITSAHCLPTESLLERHHDNQQHPPSASISGWQERTYRDLLAPLGDKPTIWTECLFLDPIADIAILGTPET